MKLLNPLPPPHPQKKRNYNGRLQVNPKAPKRMLTQIEFEPASSCPNLGLGLIKVRGLGFRVF